MTIFHCFGFPVYEIILCIKYVMTHHLKIRQMPTGFTNYVNVHKPYTWLRNHQRIRRWWHLTGGHMWLKVRDRCYSKIYIITPSSDNWVPFKDFMVVALEELKELIAHGCQVIVLIHHRLIDEAILHTRCVITCILSFGALGPERNTAVRTELSAKAIVFKEL
jgi:hypothetical protein